MIEKERRALRDSRPSRGTMSIILRGAGSNPGPKFGRRICAGRRTPPLARALASLYVWVTNSYVARDCQTVRGAARDGDSIQGNVKRGQKALTIAYRHPSVFYQQN